LLESLGATPVADPMLAVAPTGAVPRTDADHVVFTSKTGVELVADAGWTSDAAVCAIGTSTAEALRGAGYGVDLVPEEFSSAGLVTALRETVLGARVEVARSDHGSDTLLDGLNDAGAYVHETILYELTRPEGSGRSAERAASGDLDAALFTSSLTVEHFLDAAAAQGIHGAAVAGLNDAVVGCIGAPTRETAVTAGIEVDVVPDEADFAALARAVVTELTEPERELD
jgi:uroporphyrinogen-III synthase